MALAAGSENRPCGQQHGDDRHECEEGTFHRLFSDLGPGAPYQCSWPRPDTPKVRPGHGTPGRPATEQADRSGTATHSGVACGVSTYLSGIAWLEGAPLGS